ncbi:MAG TPA: thiamine pyrophosphate-dependent enzyme, partial [Methanomassiliicoccales archaeon]|nr:thiamine pyrophosphate-dependent enzyme [Methanomassiliicoccales archaeon]
RAAMKVPVVDHAFECTGAVSSGIRAALDIKGIEDVNVVGFAGDGGTVDIGLQALSGAIDRRTDMIYVMYDNEAYMNTGVQHSGSTPLYAWTNTTPGGKANMWNPTPKKRIMDMLILNGIVYGATASIAYPEDLIAKLQKAKKIKGPRFIHALSSCPAGWKIDPSKSVEVARLATQTGVFPLYEYEDGKYHLTKDVKTKPVEEYLKPQGRFRHLTPDMLAEIQKNVDEDYARLKSRCE